MDGLHRSSAQPVAAKTCERHDEGQPGPGPCAKSLQHVVERANDDRDLNAIWIRPNLHL